MFIYVTNNNICRDLSYNQLSLLDHHTITSITNLRVLKVNNNLLTCIDPDIKYLTKLEILWVLTTVSRLSPLHFLSFFSRNLHSNHLTSLPTGVLSFLPRLRQLRLDDNKIDCRSLLEKRKVYLKDALLSCGVEWLATFLRKNANLGLGTSCHSPARWVKQNNSKTILLNNIRLAGQSVSTLLSYQIPCDGNNYRDIYMSKQYI